MSTHHRTSSSQFILLKNGLERLYPFDILVHCEHNLYFLWHHFKHIGDCEFLEIITTSKEIMSFHDLGVVVFRFGLRRNESSGDTGLSYILAKGGLRFSTKAKDLYTVFVRAPFNFFCTTSRDEHRTVSGSVLSNFPSHVSNQT